ncbi:MAG TPA: hypothetical protein EYP56_01805, partial [Planctomycetaceae bacterium]|nr:hypothetical protein [Planctomycetaceae bacterium]
RPRAIRPDQLAGWLEHISQALDFIHRRGYIHRDVKPGNILFDAAGNGYLSDFGIAKVLSDREGAGQTTALTGTGFVLGTPEYLAPEVVLGKPFDGRADQYALAVVVYEVLAGRPPFTGPTPSAVLVKHSTVAPASLHQVAPAVSQELAGVVARALAKDPAARYPNCLSFAQAAVQAGRRCANRPVQARGGGAVPSVGVSTQVTPSWIELPATSGPLLRRSPAARSASGSGPWRRWVKVIAGAAAGFLVGVIVLGLILRGSKTSEAPERRTARADQKSSVGTAAGADQLEADASWRSETEHQRPAEDVGRADSPDKGEGGPAAEEQKGLALWPARFTPEAQPAQMHTAGRDQAGDPMRPPAPATMPPVPGSFGEAPPGSEGAGWDDHRPPAGDAEFGADGPGPQRPGLPLSPEVVPARPISAADLARVHQPATSSVGEPRALSPQAQELLDEAARVSMDVDTVESEAISMSKRQSGLFPLVSGDKIAALFSEDRSERLDGVTIAFHPNGKPCLRIEYKRNYKQGWLKSWDDTGRPEYLCQYTRGRKTGLCCMFDQRAPKIVMRYRGGKPAEICLVLAQGAKYFDDPDGIHSDPLAAEWWRKLAQLEGRIQKLEKKLRDSRDEAKTELRRQMAGQLWEERVGLILSRDAARRSAKAAAAAEEARRRGH